MSPKSSKAYKKEPYSIKCASWPSRPMYAGLSRTGDSEAASNFLETNEGEANFYPLPQEIVKHQVMHDGSDYTYAPL